MVWRHNERNKQVRKGCTHFSQKSLREYKRKKQFAIIQPSVKTRLGIGLNIKGVAANDKIEAAKTWNSMFTHRIKLTDEKQISQELINWIKQAYEQAG